MEADKKALEKTIQEAEERIKWQEKTLKAQEVSSIQSWCYCINQILIDVF